jgi:acetyl coenzyme A synthetase (ADP forming)-like protein
VVTTVTVPTRVTDQPAGYPEEWEADAVLKDGITVRMRPIAPTDGNALQALVQGLSSESSYYRFFRVKKELEPEEVRDFTHLDYERRMAFIAIHNGELIGVGRYDASKKNPTVAEVAFAVADDHQSRGIGTQLLRRVTAYAQLHGITAFRAFVLADNHAMMRVFRNAGFHMERDLEEGVYHVEFPTEDTDDVRAVKTRQEQRAVAASLMPIFYPYAVAVIGASRNRASIGGRLFGNLIANDFTGAVYPVNPKTPVVRSVKAYESILDVPGHVDLAFIVVPAPVVIPAIEQCIEKGVKGLVIISAGFGETGTQGRALENEVLELVRAGGMRMVGPNCMGVINTDPALHMDGQFGPIFPPRGNVAISSQSGALGLAILDYANDLNIGISSFVSVGNKADVSGNDLLLFWEEDPATDVILLYLESFGNPRRFGRSARRIARSKPIVAVKSGRTAAGARAASSHTGSLASLDVAVDALFHQAGVIRTDTLEHLFDVSALLANQPLPGGRRVGIVTNAGGPAILAVDALEGYGLSVPELSTELQDQLRGHLSPDASVRNPVDMIASAGPDQYRACLEALLVSDEVDTVVAIYIPASPVGVEETAVAIREIGEKYHEDKTFLTVYMHSQGAPKELSGERSRIPAYPFPERAARALSATVNYAEWRHTPLGDIPEYDDIDVATASQTVAAALERDEEDGVWLDPAEVDEVLAAFGLRIPAATVVSSEPEAVAAAEEIGGGVVLKVIAASALHKSDVGGVVLNVRGAEAVRSAYQQVTGAVDDAEGVLVQEFVSGGHEVLIGMTEDATFGPLIVFGLGGVFVELIGDVTFRLHPLTDLDADEMISEVRSARMLEGYRGAPPGDISGVRDALLRVSTLVEEIPEIVEMDLNPVKVGTPGEGVVIVDARIKVRRVEGSWAPTRRDLPQEL